MPNVVFNTLSAPPAPGLYIQVLNPPNFITGIATDVIGVVGTASWGPKNSPQLLGSPSQANQIFGGVTAAALTDIHDLPTDLLIAFSQAQGTGILQAWGVRVTDGTDIAASVVVTDTGGTVTGITLNAVYSGVLGNSLSMTISAGSIPTTFTVQIAPFAGGNVEVYPNLVGGAPFWAALVAALNTGIAGVRGPSVLVNGTIGTSVLGPALATSTLASGTDGRGSIISAQLVGSNASSPYTGVYALQNLLPQVGIVWCSGLSDSTIAANLTTAIASVPAWGLFTAVIGAASNTTTMLSTLQTLGIQSINLTFTGNWVYWYDPINGQIRLVPPYAFIGGTCAVIPPETSPLNVPVSGVVGTERYNPYGTPQPYTLAELGALDKAGCIIITNPIPGGATFGMASGRNTSASPGKQPVEYTRFTNFLALSLSNYMGQFVGSLQSQLPNDPTRAQVKHVLDKFTQQLLDANRISGYQNVCSFAASGNPNQGVNTPTTISQHYLYAYSAITYLASTWYFILSLQGGTTVVTSGSSSGPGQI